MANDKTYNVATFILVFSAMLAILSFFCAWIKMDAGYEGINMGWTGYSVLNTNPVDFGGIAFIPLFVLILGILLLIVAFLPKMGLNISAPKYSVILLILGFAILILAIVFMVSNFKIGDAQYNIWENLGAGVWIVLVSGILTIFGGALPALTRKV